MNDHHPPTQATDQLPPGEAGQSIVLVVLVFLALLAFVGIAVDVGFVFVRSSQFAAAVDSATLAGVVDLPPSFNPITDPQGTAAADLRAEQFLTANGWPTDTFDVFTSGRSLTGEGIPQYSLTITWPVETFFLRLLGFSDIPITRSATAAFFAQAEIYTASQYRRGVVSQASQFIFGQGACTKYGDPVSPRNSVAGGDNLNLEFPITGGIYHYRIRVPSTYTQTNIVRVELLDPDSINNVTGSTVAFTHTLAYGGGGGSANCGAGDGQMCFVETGESFFTGNQNPFWFWRLDENYDSSCNPLTSDPFGNTVTTFDLFYYNTSGNKVPLAKYVDNNAYYNSTDMKWVSPGVTAGVPTASGSFEVDITPLPADALGARYIHLDVTAIGNSKNGWDIWAGLPSGYYSFTMPSDINVRNLALANSPAADATNGVRVYALGRISVQNFYNTLEVKLPLANINSRQAGGTIYATLFDYDTGLPSENITMTIDTLGWGDFRVPFNIVSTVPDPNPPDWEANCDDPADPLDNPLDCDNWWLYPQYKVGIPTGIFVGGTLEANYTPYRDAHTWLINITAGRPFLTR
ncbi:MAG: pilus assembly protein TadG-related protein [Chloroflexi bacterium]|nr:pilus assembly protein TadG-related protein [Chloroflexota bacterium]MCI0576205.1 pilus assembly protein TadG-related protein [Chloroflexota bacterium]MCI0645501.1 pilus assembly protein TadG-related protein [Chloroflexota bacterium]MCI0730640.1 pilus assembly protein TadG-related protein [Chloroflexota bacterium]